MGFYLFLAFNISFLILLNLFFNCLLIFLFLLICFFMFDFIVFFFPFRFIVFFFLFLNCFVMLHLLDPSAGSKSFAEHLVLTMCVYLFLAFNVGFLILLNLFFKRLL